jgi:hypothetical protein
MSCEASSGVAFPTVCQSTPLSTRQTDRSLWDLSVWVRLFGPIDAGTGTTTTSTFISTIPAPFCLSRYWLLVMPRWRRGPLGRTGQNTLAVVWFIRDGLG